MVHGHAAQITDLFNLVVGYGFEIPALDMAAFKTMYPDITTILQVMEVLDAGQEEQTQLFAKDLAEGQLSCPQLSCAAAIPQKAAWLTTVSNFLTRQV